MHKIRTVIWKSDNLYLLKGMGEYDDACVEKVSKRTVQDRLKPGKGSQKQIIVAVALESTPLENPLSGNKRRHCDFFKLIVLGDLTRVSFEGFVKKSIDSKSGLPTYKNSAHVNLEKMEENHFKVKSSSESGNGDLNLVHIAINILKRNLLGIYHMVSEKHFQSCLNEFTYKFNRRCFGDKLYDRLIIASVYPYVQHSY